MESNRSIPSLQPGDLIYITSPAKSIEKGLIDHAKSLFEERGYRVILSEHCSGVHHYFSGTDEERLKDLQYGIDHPEVKAIICARGGYGCVRIVDLIGWAGMIRDPKWLVGFSDVTVFHQRLQRFGLESIHGTMPLNFQQNSTDSIQTLFDALEGREYAVNCAPHPKNKNGQTEGKLVGGNLSILFSLLGTNDRIDYSDCILFIEDLSEQLYHIDRIFQSLRKAGILDEIKGLIVGSMTDMKDTAAPFGTCLEEIILNQFKYRNIPVCFGFPSGHIDDNRALILGRNVILTVDQGGTKLQF